MNNELKLSHERAPSVEFIRGGNCELRAYLERQLQVAENEISRGRSADHSTIERALTSFHTFITKAQQAGISLHDRHAMYMRSFDLRDEAKALQLEREGALERGAIAVKSTKLKQTHPAYKEVQLEIEI